MNIYKSINNNLKESSYNSEDGKTDEQVYEEYMAQEKEAADRHYKSLCDDITDERREKFSRLKELIDDGGEKEIVNGFWLPTAFIYAIENAGKGHHLNPYMDLTTSNIYFLVDENDTIEDALKSLFDEYKADSAYSWGDNFLYALDRANPDAYQEFQDEYDQYDDEESWDDDDEEEELDEAEAPQVYERGNAPFESKRVPEDRIREEGYQYFSTHGLGPGTHPRDVRVRELDVELPSGWVTFKTDRPLTSEELEWYGIQPETRNREFRQRFGLEEK